MIIDVHTHIASLGLPELSLTPEQLLGRLLKEAAENKVDKVLVIAGFKQRDTKNDSTSRLLELTKNQSKVSLVGSIDVLRYTKDHLSKMERWLREKKIVGLKIYTGYQHVFPTDKRCVPLYRLCMKYEAPIIFHSGDTLAGYVADPKLKYSHPLLIDDVAVDFPKLKIVIAHLGNPWLNDTAELLYKNQNVYADISGLVVGDSLSTSYGDLMASRIKELIAYAGSDKLMYGTDWPLCPMKTYLQFVNRLGLSKKEKEGVMSKNAIRLFHF